MLIDFYPVWGLNLLLHEQTHIVVTVILYTPKQKCVTYTPKH